MYLTEFPNLVKKTCNLPSILCCNAMKGVNVHGKSNSFCKKLNFFISSFGTVLLSSNKFKVGFFILIN